MEIALGLMIDGGDGSERSQQSAIEALLDDLQSDPRLSVSIEAGTSSGAKGALDNALLTLGPAGVAGLVQIVKYWLDRDGSRALTVRVSRPGQEDAVIEVTGDKISNGEIQKALDAAIAELENS